MALLRKIKALAVGGLPGERAAAQARLESLLAKHGITEDQLDESEGRLHYFRFCDRHEQTLIIAIVAKVACGGSWPDLYNGDSRRDRIWFKLTPAQIIDAETYFAFYRKLWKEECQVFFRAFVFAQNLGMNPSDPDREYTDEELAEYKRISGMKMFVRSRTPHRQLEVAES